MINIEFVAKTLFLFSNYVSLYLVSKEVPSFPAFGLYIFPDIDGGNDGRKIKLGIDLGTTKLITERSTFSTFLE